MRSHKHLCMATTVCVKAISNLNPHFVISFVAVILIQFHLLLMTGLIRRRFHRVQFKILYKFARANEVVNSDL